MTVRTGVEAMDMPRVHGWLASTYWSPEVAYELVERAAQGSALVVGAFDEDEQIGYLRVVSDKATFAWVADVFVDPAHRGKGVATMMLRHAQEHPELQGLRRWLLATRDAQELYATVGFEVIPNPQNVMQYRPQPA